MVCCCDDFETETMNELESAATPRRNSSNPGRAFDFYGLNDSHHPPGCLGAPTGLILCFIAFDEFVLRE